MRSVRSQLRAVLLLIGVWCGLLAIMPPGALAGEAAVTPLGTLRYSASGETNVVAISREEPCTTAVALACYVIKETGPGASITTTNCTPVDSETVVCSAGGVVGIEVDVADGDDQVTITAPTPSDISAGVGNDILNGGSGVDILRGQAGRDTVNGNGGKDEAYGNDVLAFLEPDEPNTFDGGEGNDTFEAGAGGDTARGGNGNDMLFGAAGNDSLDGGAGDDQLTGADGNDAMLGQEGNDTLGRPDQLGTTPVARERGDDTFDGGPGDDTLRAGIGPTGGVSDRDTFVGGDGVDTVTYDQRSATLAISLDAQRDDGAAGENDEVFASVENVSAGKGADTLTGSGAVNRLDGGERRDIINGGAGGDVLVGSDGDDDLRGLDGDDEVQGGPGEDFVDGGAGADVLSGGGASDTVQSREKGGSGLDKVDCGERVDFSIADRHDKVASDCNHVDRIRRDRPVIGSRAALQPVAGDVELGLPEAHRLVPLEVHANAPVGSIVDTTKGRVRLATVGRGVQVSARSKRVRRQSAVLSRGEFRVRQRRLGNGITDIFLRGDSFKSCRSGRAGAHASRKSWIRRLLMRARGRFRTRGHYSATTVRGTKWLTEDRCNGTLTRVIQGRVVVFDKVRKRNVRVRAGHSYLAKAP
jgi:Ca2+-binding RTX toxin-like protein